MTWQKEKSSILFGLCFLSGTLYFPAWLFYAAFCWLLKHLVVLPLCSFVRKQRLQRRICKTFTYFPSISCFKHTFVDFCKKDPVAHTEVNEWFSLEAYEPYMDNVQATILRLSNGEICAIRHETVTTDGYQLIMHHLWLTSRLDREAYLAYLKTSNQYDNQGTPFHLYTQGFKKPQTALFVHGLFESSLNWVSSGEMSLPAMLLRKNWDIWIGNNRGNTYSSFAYVTDGNASSYKHKKLIEGCVFETVSPILPSCKPHTEKVNNFDIPLCTFDNGTEASAVVGSDRESTNAALTTIHRTQHGLAEKGTVPEKDGSAKIVLNGAIQRNGFSKKCYYYGIGVVKNLFRVLKRIVVYSIQCTHFIKFKQLFLTRFSILTKALFKWREQEREDWSFEDMGFFDIPAMISHIETIHQEASIVCVGQSQGAAQLLIAASLQKINSVKDFHLFNPPVVLKPFRKLPFSLGKLMKWGLENISVVLSIIRWYRKLCPEPFHGIVSNFTASKVLDFYRSPIHFEAGSIIYQNTPNGGTSAKNCEHWKQLIESHEPLRRLKDHPSEMSALYPLSNIAAPVHVYFGENDNIVNVDASISYLKANLNASNCNITKWPHWSHVDFGWGTDRHIDFYPYVIAALEEHSVLNFPLFNTASERG